jgi:hypothetical protein
MARPRRHFLLPVCIHGHPPARRKILGLRLDYELADHLGGWTMKGLGECLQLSRRQLIQAYPKLPTEIAGLMRPARRLCRTPTAGEIFGGNPPHRLAKPCRHAHSMGHGGGLRLLEEVGFQQYRHRGHRADGRPIDGPCLRVAEPPLHHIAQDGRALPVEGGRQYLQPGVRVRVESGLVPGIVADMSRLGGPVVSSLAIVLHPLAVVEGIGVETYPFGR